MTAITAPATASRSPFGVRDFRLLWTGEAISSLGDQFALIALPWLALVLTGSALALGGVSVDRFSPRRVMLGSNAVRLIAVTALGVVVLAGAAQLWMLYAFALVFGVADAFFFPAQTSIVPELVDGEQLQRANGIVQGTAQATVLVGPALAGVVIATLGSGTTSANSGGIGIALLIDAATFLASLVTLWLIHPRAHVAQPPTSILESIRQGLRFVWGSPGLRAVILLSLSANFFIVGPFEVGMPFIAYSRLPEGAAAFGIVMAAFGGGSLLGLIVASVLPAPRPSRLGLTVIGTLALAGLGVAAVALVHTTLLAALVIGMSGTMLGVGNLIGITWIQGRIPPELMGRVMSLMITGSVGLIPVSMLVAGVAVQASVDGTMLVAGLGMAILAGGSLLSPVVRNLGLERLATAEPAPTAAIAGDAAGV